MRGGSLGRRLWRLWSYRFLGTIGRLPEADAGYWMLDARYWMLDGRYLIGQLCNELQEFGSLAIGTGVGDRHPQNDAYEITQV